MTLHNISYISNTTMTMVKQQLTDMLLKLIGKVNDRLTFQNHGQDNKIVCRLKVIIYRFFIDIDKYYQIRELNEIMQS